MFAWLRTATREAYWAFVLSDYDVCKLCAVDSENRKPIRAQALCVPDQGLPHYRGEGRWLTCNTPVLRGVTTEWPRACGLHSSCQAEWSSCITLILIFVKVYRAETSMFPFDWFRNKVLVMVNNFPGLPAIEMHLQDSNSGWLFSLSVPHPSKRRKIYSTAISPDF